MCKNVYKSSEAERGCRFTKLMIELINQYEKDKSTLNNIEKNQIMNDKLLL